MGQWLARDGKKHQVEFEGFAQNPSIRGCMGNKPKVEIYVRVRLENLKQPYHKAV
jgi:hypothetical protein